MKKIVAILLAALMAFGLTSCASIKIEKEDSGHMLEKYTIEELMEFLTKSEHEVITPEDNGYLAPAKDSATGFYGYVNIFGDWVLQPKYVSTVQFKEDFGLCLNSYGGYEYINRQGKNVFRSYTYNWETFSIDYSNHFSNGLLALKLNTGAQGYMYVNTSFRPVITADGLPRVNWRWYKYGAFFGVATPFNEDGYAAVMRKTNASCDDWLDAEKAYIIDKTGAIKASLPAGLDIERSGIDSNGNILVKNPRTNLFGLCNSEGKQVLECNYRFLRNCGGSLYLTCNDNGFFGYIDSEGNEVIPFQYQKALPFSDGLAAVYDGKYWGFIDETGKLVIESVFDDVAALYTDNLDYPASKGVFADGYAVVSKNGYWAVIDKDEVPVFVLTPENCEGITGCPIVGVLNGLITYGKNVDGKILYGVADTNGHILMTPQFDSLGVFN